MMSWPQILTVAWYVSYWVLIVAALFIVPVNRKPSSATAWLMLIALFPPLGLLVFFLIGSPKLPRVRRRKQRKMDDLVAEAAATLSADPELAPYYAPQVPPRAEPYAALSHQLGGMPAFAGNCVEPIAEYAEVFRRMAADIDGASRYVHVQFYILTCDDETAPVFAALERAARRGVKVRIMLDDIGSRKFPTDKPTMRYFAEQGFEYRRMLPFDLLDGQWLRPDLRNHRKIVVIDGQVGYTGSLNMIRRDYFRKDGMYYDELVMRTAGPVVAQLEAIFVTDWFCETDVLLAPINAPETAYVPRRAGDVLAQALPSGSGHDDENNLKVFTALMQGARRRLVVVNPYFVPDDALMLAICSAAQRGVDVTMINSEAPDQFMVFHAQRSFYAELLRCGVKIRLYKQPVLLHSKFMLIDDEIAMVGSSNLDMRSFHLNLEVSVIYYDGAVVARLYDEVVVPYLGRSIPVTPDAWERRPARVKLFENVMRLTSALQ
jgi:cardiolipin synthase